MAGKVREKSKKETGLRGTLRKEGAPRQLLYLRLISFQKRCNPCGYAVFSLLRWARWVLEGFFHFLRGQLVEALTPL